MYMDKTLGFRFETFYSISDYELKKIVKFASTSKLNVIKFSSCDDLKYEIFKSEWDIYVMWVDPRKVKPSDTVLFNKKIPNFNDNTLYNLFVFHENNNKTKMKELMHFLRKNYKPRKIENVLGLDYSYYVKNNNTSSFI